MPDETLPEGVEVLSPIDTIVKRMNVGAMYEPYFSGISREIKREVIKHYNKSDLTVDKLMDMTTRSVNENDILVKEVCKSSIEYIENSDTSICWDMITDMLQPIDNIMYRYYMGATELERKIVLKDIFIKECTIIYNVSDKRAMDIVNLWDKNKLSVSKHSLTFFNPFDNKEHNVKIIDEMTPMPMYFVMQSKIPFDGLLTNTANVNHFGLPVTVTATNKYRLPFKNNPSKTYDETFTRILTNHCPERMIAELMSRASSPDLQKTMCENILKAHKPTNINMLLDRDKLLYGNSKSLDYANHILNTGGVSVDYIKDTNVHIVPKDK